jgi:aerobic-type carbon monoxide dehydrogenase small subunit (CoxS/CutS family)
MAPSPRKRRLVIDQGDSGIERRTYPPVVPSPTRPTIQLEVDGQQVTVPDDGGSLLDALRESLGHRSVKDGCSPQGQCGCCTVLVDGAPRVACVTPTRRVAGRSVTTLDGLEPEVRARWGEAFCATGASQCGFCTPGIILRLEGLRRKERSGPEAVESALLAHLCRCTGWRTILDAWDARDRDDGAPIGRDLAAASTRATLEGGTPQRVGPDVALGNGGFADDTAPADALVAVPDGRGGWSVGETLGEARAAAGKVQGRRTTMASSHPLELPEGDWAATLRTTWVEPAYLETDASWCVPGGEPASPLANGGAFGGKVDSAAPAAARALADEHGRAVRVVYPREDTVRLGSKRPPVAGGADADGTGVLRVVRTPGIVAAVASVAPGLRVEEVDVLGPRTSSALRAAGWAEATVLLAGARGAVGSVHDPSGASAEAAVEAGRIRVRVRCGDPLDEVVLRSYCVGAAHMALSWVTSEALAVDASGEIQDLTIRSFGIVRATDMPPVDVEIDDDGGPPVRGSDAVFVAVAAAVWLAGGRPSDWPTGERIR